MRLADDFRSIAREVLRGKWKIAVLVGLVASMLGAVEGMGPEVKFSIEESSVKASLEFAGNTFFQPEEVLTQIWELLWLENIHIS